MSGSHALTLESAEGTKRIVTQELQQHVDQSFAIENQTGSGVAFAIGSD